MICLKSCSKDFIQTPGCCLQVGSSFPSENSDIFWEERRKGRKGRREGERRKGKRKEKRGQEGREGRKGKGREGRGKYHFTVSTSFSPVPNKNKLGLLLSKAERASPDRRSHSETRSAHPLPAQAGTRHTRSSGRRPEDHYSPGIQALQKPSFGGGGAGATSILVPSNPRTRPPAALSEAVGRAASGDRLASGRLAGTGVGLGRWRPGRCSPPPSPRPPQLLPAPLDRGFGRSGSSPRAQGEGQRGCDVCAPATHPIPACLKEESCFVCLLIEEVNF